MTLASFTQLLLSWVWSPWLVALCLATGLWFSARTRFIQLRGLPAMLRLVGSTRRSASGISPLQALSISLSNRVGVGNIAGVAMAIAFGGPGAVFWMWVVAMLGASSAFIESTLAQIYKEPGCDGVYRGGPAYYIEKGLGMRRYAHLFALCTVAAAALLAGTQSNTIASVLDEAWRIPPGATAGVLLVLLAAVIFGGVRRIAQVAQWVVPAMAAAYLLLALGVLAFNMDRVPGVFLLIVRSAFGIDAAFGAMLGTAIQWGVRRGVLSNEAGMGSGAHPAAAADVAHPVEQGLVQAFSVYVDTLVVCSATAFLILGTGLYNVYDPAVGGVPDASRMLVAHLPGVEPGPRFVQHAVGSVMPGAGPGIVALAILPFAFTTLLGLYYMAETNLAYLGRQRGGALMITAFRVLFLTAAGWCAVNNATVAWALGDLGVGLMSWLNIIAILLLQKPALAALRDYDQARAAGRTLDFDPQRLGIRNAGVWSRLRDPLR